MKYISQLGEARKRIAELEAEVSELRKRLNKQEAPGLRQSTTPSVRHNTVPTTLPHYALPTRSSQRKTLPEPDVDETEKDESRRVVHINGITYTYNNGTPILAALDISHKSYMRPTDASSKRALLSPDLGWGGASNWPNPPLYNESDLSESPSLESVTQSFDDSCSQTSSTSSSSSVTPPPDQEEEENKVDHSLEKVSRLDEGLKVDIKFVRTDSKKNLDYLCSGLRLAQKAIHREWCKDGLGGDKTQDFGDGPHTIPLGFTELTSWLDKFPRPGLARYGYSGYVILEAILGVVDPRNTMSHPTASELRNPFMIDGYLKKLQFVCIVLRYDEGAMEVRKLRDSLLADAREVCHYIENLHHWFSLPFVEEMEVQEHHIAMFKKCVRDWQGTGYNPEPGQEEQYDALHSLALNWTDRFPERSRRIRLGWS
ncbi:hypothetical protein NPX13_g3894 [Xylaria arbuscula]|uniref:Uncharacterized protein n=1 Tax=Xylaria arbuscula TaxID=114810 RepID=A0A9W8NHE0_9PEZI|nr:hypothetical protein NPX13_g3894 [Xylaria arbuscula]